MLPLPARHEVAVYQIGSDTIRVIGAGGGYFALENCTQGCDYVPRKREEAKRWLQSRNAIFVEIMGEYPE